MNCKFKWMMRSLLFVVEVDHRKHIHRGFFYCLVLGAFLDVIVGSHELRFVFIFNPDAERAIFVKHPAFTKQQSL